MAEREKNISTQLKRRVTSHLIKALWPVEFAEEATGNLAAFNKRLRDSHGAIGLVPHFSKGDFLTILCALIENSKELLKKPILIPIAAHQRPGYLNLLCEFTEINLATIVTIDTRNKEKELKSSDKPVPWQIPDTETAVNEYMRRAASTLDKGGVVILAPQGGRRNLLTPFKGGPLNRLEQKALEMGVDNLAYFAVGVEIPGVQDYSQFKGLNLRSRYRITLGEITERARITENIDSWGYQQMFKLAPSAYKPQKNV